MGSPGRSQSGHSAGFADVAASHRGLPGYRALQPTAVAGHPSAHAHAYAYAYAHEEETPLPR
jgi:hypothetical protein